MAKIKTTTEVLTVDVGLGEAMIRMQKAADWSQERQTLPFVKFRQVDDDSHRTRIVWVNLNAIVQVVEDIWTDYHDAKK